MFWELIAMKPFAEKFYKSLAWIECRLSFMVSKFFICNRCGGAATIAHHIIYLTAKNINDPEISLNHDNLEALCHDCHNNEHFRKSDVVAEGLMFDESGQLVKRG